MNDGYPVIAFSNPLRGPASDGAYLRTFLGTIEGPIVLVGHSYGGVVITDAATGNDNVQSLVYIAAYAPAEGESVADANHLGDGHTVVTDHLVVRPFPGASAGDADAYIDPGVVPRALRPRPAPQDRAVHGCDAAPGSARSTGDSLGPAGVGRDPELVHGGEPGPHHPARG